MMISRTGLHALLALSTLAELADGGYVGASQLAGAIGAPPNYLAKMLQTLSEHGLLESQRGKGGGFRLSRPAEDISLLDVLEPLERINRWSGCFLGRPECLDEEPCVVHERWKPVRDAYVGFLQTTSVADLARQRPRVFRPPR